MVEQMSNLLKKRSTKYLGSQKILAHQHGRALGLVDIIYHTDFGGNAVVPKFRRNVYLTSSAMDGFVPVGGEGGGKWAMPPLVEK